MKAGALLTSEPVEMDVVIVHYHAASAVRLAVEALLKDAEASGLRIHVLVADNGSTADERTVLGSLPVSYLCTGRNAGYAGAINAAVPATGADVVAVMNEDVLVLPGCLRALHRELHQGAAAAGPLFFWDLDRTFILPCLQERSRKNELLKVSGRRNAQRLERARMRWRQHVRTCWQSEVPVQTTSLSGAFLAFRRDTWEAIGPFDEDFRLYYEENDWLIRAERAGLRTRYVPGAKAIHLHNPISSASERAEWEAESFLRFGRRYYGESFMRRLCLVSSRPATISLPEHIGPAPIAVDVPGDSSWPLWVEVSPAPSGFPAAATRITDRAAQSWSLPPLRGLEFLQGTLYVQIVDDRGTELKRFRLDRSAESAHPLSS
jgi:N-acetylglucosaminyl-diphospho-decaprenol L-rhamnosyltransferase